MSVSTRLSLSRTNIQARGVAEAELAEAETQKTPATSLRRIGTNLTMAENPVWNENPM